MPPSTGAGAGGLRTRFVTCTGCVLATSLGTALLCGLAFVLLFFVVAEVAVHSGRGRGAVRQLESNPVVGTGRGGGLTKDAAVQEGFRRLLVRRRPAGCDSAATPPWVSPLFAAFGGVISGRDGDGGAKGVGFALVSTERLGPLNFTVPASTSAGTAATLHVSFRPVHFSSFRAVCEARGRKAVYFRCWPSFGTVDNVKPPLASIMTCL